MITVDARCGFRGSCSPDIYRMVGACLNCRTDNILILYTVGHEASKQKCPICGNFWSVSPQRRATDEEVPAA